MSKILAEGGGGGLSTTPHPLYHGDGMNLRVRPRVKLILIT